MGAHIWLIDTVLVVIHALHNQPRYRGTSLIRNRPPLQDLNRSLGMLLL